MGKERKKNGDKENNEKKRWNGRQRGLSRGTNKQKKGEKIFSHKLQKHRNWSG